MSRLATNAGGPGQETVETGPNYDGSLQEPLVLRPVSQSAGERSAESRWYGNNIPPHNLSEVIDAIIAIIGDRICPLKTYPAHPRPDFPTGGFIYGREGIIQGYKTDAGSCRCAPAPLLRHTRNRAPVHHVTEIPYQVNKANLVAKIADWSGRRLRGFRIFVTSRTGRHAYSHDLNGTKTPR